MTTTIEEVQNSLTSKEYLVLDKKENLVLVFDRSALMKHSEQKIKRIYRIIDNKGTLEEINLKKAINSIIKAVKTKVTLEKVLTAVLKAADPEQIVKALQAIQTGKATVKPENGCLALSIRNGKGKEAAYFAIGAK